MKTILFIYFTIACSYANSEDQISRTKLTKRGIDEISYSYSATDVGSKSGTRIKTITVIKNIPHIKDKPLKIDPELHKDENWGSVFRDNFDSLGKIPDLPEIFVKQEDPKAEQPKIEVPIKEIPIYEKPDTESHVEEPKEEAESEAHKESEQSSRIVEKLPDEVELIDIGPISLKNAARSAKSQSLRFSSFGRQNEQKEYNENPPPFELMRQHEQTNPSQLPSELRYKSSQNLNSENKYRQNYKHTYKAAESNTQSVYTNNPSYMSIPYNPTTTASTPYIAPSQKQQLFKQNSTKQQQGVSSTSETPYIAPSVRKAYPATSMPISGQLSNVRTNGDFNPYQVPRFRGARY